MLCFHFVEFKKWQQNRTRLEQVFGRYRDEHKLKQSIINIESPASSTLTEDEKKERKRQLNIIHSRQKRERRKTEADELERQCTELKDQQNILLTENGRLENLLVDANHLVAVFKQGGVSNVIRQDDAPSFGSSNFCQHLLSRQLLLNQMGSGFPPAGSTLPLTTNTTMMSASSAYT